MCDVCKAAMALWPNDDEELTGREFAELMALAQLIELIPGSHLVGVGVTGSPHVQ